jgi:hydrogenase maturation protease
MGLEPGEYELFCPGQVESRKELAGISTHEGDVMKVLELATSLGRLLPAITILGIEPQEMRGEIGLSAALSARFEEYINVAVGYFGSER